MWPVQPALPAWIQSGFVTSPHLLFISEKRSPRDAVPAVLSGPSVSGELIINAHSARRGAHSWLQILQTECVPLHQSAQQLRGSFLSSCDVAL